MWPQPRGQRLVVDAVERRLRHRFDDAVDFAPYCVGEPHLDAVASLVPHQLTRSHRTPHVVVATLSNPSMRDGVSGNDVACSANVVYGILGFLPRRREE